MKKTLGFCLAIGVLGLTGCSKNTEQARANLEDQAVLNVKEKLISPDLAQFRNQKGACGEVNSKNEKDEFTGFQKYVVVDNIVIFEDDSSTVFKQQWNKHCKNY